MGKATSVKDAVKLVRETIQASIPGGPGEMLRAFKEFRFKSGSDDNQVCDCTRPRTVMSLFATAVAVAPRQSGPWPDRSLPTATIHAGGF